MHRAHNAAQRAERGCCSASHFFSLMMLSVRLAAAMLSMYPTRSTPDIVARAERVEAEGVSFV